MRISDWSSDVCSSDLRILIILEHGQDHRDAEPGGEGEEESGCDLNHDLVLSVFLCETLRRPATISWPFHPMFSFCSQRFCDERSCFVVESRLARTLGRARKVRTPLAFGGQGG